MNVCFRIFILKKCVYISMSGCSVTGRLVAINQELDSLAWDGLEERRLMEAKRAKLLDQLGETKLLWANIERRSDTVVSQVKKYLPLSKNIFDVPKKYLQVDHYAGKGEGAALSGWLRTKVQLMVSKKELEEKIELGEKQLGAMKVIETFEVIV